MLPGPPIWRSNAPSHSTMPLRSACALAEGLCMVSALSQDLDTLETAAQTLTRTASHHGLHFWKAYGDLYELWAMMQHKETPASGRIPSVIRRLDEMQFDLCYTPFVADVLCSRKSQAALFHPSVDCEDGHWAMPEFLRIEAEFDLEHNAGQPDSTVEHRLERALALAQECGARSWELKVAATLAHLLISDNRRDEAQILLRKARFRPIPAATNPTVCERRTPFGTNYGIRQHAKHLPNFANAGFVVRRVEGRVGRCQTRAHSTCWLAPAAAHGGKQKIDDGAVVPDFHNQPLGLSGPWKLYLLDLERLASGLKWSGREDSNLRPPGPEPGALPDCATPRTMD